MKEEIISLLKENKDNFISGEKISEKFGITRAAIWKYMKAIKNEGYKIESVSRKGYKLISSPDLLTFQEINPYLTTNYIGKNIMYFNTIDSTNNKAKELGAKGILEGTVVISEEQTGGRGRLGRQWVSPKFKGIWMSVILRPNIEPMEASKITQIAAAAVCSVIKELGIDVYIKWPNDIVLNNKKICGILTEMSGEINKINYIVLGIGINVNIDEEDLPEYIKDIATSIKIETGLNIQRKELIAKIFNKFEILYDEFINEGTIKKSIEICKGNSALLGKEVKIIRKSTEVFAKALTIAEDGELIVEYNDGKVEKIVSGEVSIRGIYGYV
ncbi:biotin--acetyl-CoA-carboxylase ligase [Clostridium novyi B str. ATCC 27606]|uniref:Bifunctional ligase/repressor BirA n=2 Tax=Clostridium TaxID=1485 RepID=A0AA40ISM3_CLONO|nr:MULTISPECIES: biotin--[acetyl-CoA-carboxylase] ligase [Clostridium]KEI11561.1 biotin--acetyl-CoA-carboxylase ligase [Clostridium novyi B str. NCTC 9691]KEI13128.1 biotin--acetyl-CoA-carboxylase ligase [Clostridium novyi B str. ATCC 27606]KEI15545.1 biotin--acetyl-CoA-carboxylase ligase [Clostridium haemolyticum NCTC 9693]KGN02084.1 biotin--acetyl-CoA-carboxylase ligase [Clostridium haemolyticum NCTC 8350]OOB75648.1 biotin--acetyl-CoA-carboxylase ligase [Clostridium haemolyticum]